MHYAFCDPDAVNSDPLIIMASLYDITEFIAGEIQSTEGIQIQDYNCLFLSKP